jgi:dipeptidyl aminopeptidase/acylaminoacyl peptidase
VSFPVYITDAAEAVRWAIDHAVSLGAQPAIYVGGHSAGGYIAALLAMDDHYLKDAGVAADRIAGYIPMSSQMTTHFTVAEERGISSKVITVDDAAPLHHLREGTPPMLVLIADDDWPARLEENEYFVAALKKVGGNSNVSLSVVKDRDHSSILKKTAETNDPAASAILGFVRTGVLPTPSA